MSSTQTAGVEGNSATRHEEHLSPEMYEAIRDQLRAELYIDRERAGLVTDLVI